MRKIALVGTASSGSGAPYDDPSWEIWGVSARANYVTRANRWFELHRLDGEPPDWAAAWRVKVKEWIGDIPLYMIYPERDLAKNVVAFPTQRLMDRFGTYFMTSTFSWMMAMAIDELRPVNGPAVEGQIAIYGVDMEYGTEYRQQRAGFHHFFHLANFLGISIMRLADSGLAYQPIPYPMWQDDPLLSKNSMRMKQATEQIKLFDDSRHTTQTMMAQAHACIALLNRLKVSNDDGFVDKELTSQQQQLIGLTATSSSISRDIVSLEGQLSEQKWLSDYLQP